jgi:hypothetical protein
VRGQRWRLRGATRCGVRPARAREVGDDCRVPPVGESQEEGGGTGCSGPLVGCRKLGRTRAITSWATALTKESWARSKEVERREKKPLAIFQKSSQNLNSNTNLNSNK